MKVATWSDFRASIRARSDSRLALKNRLVLTTEDTTRTTATATDAAKAARCRVTIFLSW